MAGYIVLEWLEIIRYIIKYEKCLNWILKNNTDLVNFVQEENVVNEL